MGVQILQSFLGISKQETLHIGDQFLNTGNDFAARDVCPCVWITSPEETTYILKCILRNASVVLEDSDLLPITPQPSTDAMNVSSDKSQKSATAVNFEEIQRRSQTVAKMNVFTGEIETGATK